jgi:uncharacterized membrane protein YfcA
MGLFSEDWGTLAVVLAGALAGGFANGLTGFGTGLTALPFWLQVVEPVIAAQLASACGVIGQVATLPTIWHAIDWRRLAPILLAGLAGVPIGIFLLPYVSLGTFKLTVGLVLIAYCSFMLLAAGRIKLIAGRQGAEMAVGLHGRHSGRSRGPLRPSAHHLGRSQGLAEAGAAHFLSGLQRHDPVGDAGGQLRAGPRGLALPVGPCRRCPRHPGRGFFPTKLDYR